jgi:hypothetical protein
MTARLLFAVIVPLQCQMKIDMCTVLFLRYSSTLCDVLSLCALFPIWFWYSSNYVLGSLRMSLSTSPLKFKSYLWTKKCLLWMKTETGIWKWKLFLSPFKPQPNFDIAFIGFIRVSNVQTFIDGWFKNNKEPSIGENICLHNETLS